MTLTLILALSAVLLSAFAFFVSLFIAFFTYPRILEMLIDKRGKDLSTHTVVPGEVIEAMAKDPDFHISEEDIDSPERIRTDKKRARYGDN